MKNKKLNLDQLKVKSFVTTINFSKQIAAKGGATYDKEFDSCVLDEVIVISVNTTTDDGGGGDDDVNKPSDFSCASCVAQVCH